MKPIQSTETKEQLRPHKFRKHAPLLAGLAISGMIALSPFAMAQRRAADQCSASVQSGSMPGFHSTGAHGVHLFNSPLIRRENSYVSVTVPASYVQRLTAAARDRPEAERRVFVSDALQRNIELAITTIGTQSRVTFDCVSVSTSSASASVSVPVPDARVPADAGTAQTARPVPSADAGVPAQDDAGASRHRVIQPGQ
jgi:hypothetical protein